MFRIPRCELALRVALCARASLRSREKVAEDHERREGRRETLRLHCLRVHNRFERMVRLHCLRKIVFQGFAFFSQKKNSRFIFIFNPCTAARKFIHEKCKAIITSFYNILLLLCIDAFAIIHNNLSSRRFRQWWEKLGTMGLYVHRDFCANFQNFVKDVSSKIFAILPHIKRRQILTFVRNILSCVCSLQLKSALRTCY